MQNYILKNITTGIKENLTYSELYKRIYKEKNFFDKYTYYIEYTFLEKIFNNKYVLNFLLISAGCMMGGCIAALIFEGIVFFTN